MLSLRHIARLITSIIIGCHHLAPAQSNFAQAEDSLFHLLEQEDLPVRQRIKTHLSLVGLYHYAHPTVDSLLSTGIHLAKEHNLPFFEARSRRFRTRHLLYLNGKPEDIRYEIGLIEQIWQEKLPRNKLIPGWISGMYAMYYLQTGELDSVPVLLDSLKSQLNNNSYVDHGVYHTLQGIYHHKTRHYEEALDSYRAALSSRQGGKQFVLNHIGRLYLEMQQATKAISTAKEAIALGRKNDFDIPQVESLIIMGEANLIQGDTSTALLHLSEALDIQSKPYFSKNYTPIPLLVDISRQQSHHAGDTLLETIDQYNGSEYYGLLLTQKGEMALSKRQLSDAKKLCMRGLSQSLKRSNYRYAVRACTCLSAAAVGLDDYKLATETLQSQASYQLKLQDEKQLVSLANTLAKYESDKQNELIALRLQNDEKLLQEKENKYRFIIGLGGLILVSLLGFVLLIRRKNRLIESKRQEIAKSLTEKETLLKEIHHRVKNNLQLVSSLLTLQGATIEDNSAAQAIAQSKSRVRSMALIHQDLYSTNDVDKIDIKRYVTKLADELFFSHNVDQYIIKLTSEIADIKLDADTVTPLGLIINELITNSLKYAFPDNRSGKITIRINEHRKNLSLVVADNGVGYDLTQEKKASFGTTLIESLSEQLDGQLTRTSNQKGTTTRLDFTIYSE